MLKLGVNIDHVATLREARYRGQPDFAEARSGGAALVCVKAGAHGITVHLREDRRHIQDRDVWKLREAITRNLLKTRLNLEMANAPEIVAIALKLKTAHHFVWFLKNVRKSPPREGWTLLAIWRR